MSATRYYRARNLCGRTWEEYVNWCVNWYRKAEKLDSAGTRRSVNCPEEGLNSEAISCGTVNITSKWGIMENVGGNRVTGFRPLLADVWEVCLAAFSSDITGWLFGRLSSSKVFLQGKKSISPFHTLHKGRGEWVGSFFSLLPFPPFLMYPGLLRVVAINIAEIPNWLLKAFKWALLR